MKNLLLFALLSALLISCNKDESSYDNYWQSLGIYELTGDGSTDFQILLDNGNTVVPVEITQNSYVPEDGDRVFIYFSIIQEISGDDGKITYNAAIHSIQGILTKDVITLTEENADSIGNDPIYVDSNDIWFTKNYLNIYFSYYANQQIHYVNLIKYPNDSIQSDGRLILEFRHNANSDEIYYLYNDMVAFDMNSLYKDGVDSIPFLVKVIDYNSDTLEWENTYYFDNPPTSSKIINSSSLKYLVE